MSRVRRQEGWPGGRLLFEGEDGEERSCGASSYSDPSTVVVASLVFSLSFTVGAGVTHPFYRWGVEAQRQKQLLQ